MLYREIIVPGFEGRCVDILKLHIDKLEALDKGPIAESAGLNLLDSRVANDHVEDSHGTKGVLAYHPH